MKSVTFLALCGLLGLGLNVSAQTTPEYKLKGVFLFNFVQFVDWPTNAFADSASPIIIGVLGTDPFGETLDETVHSEIVKNRRIEVRRYKKVKEVSECHVLFVSSSEESKLNSILASLKERSILTVSDTEGFVGAGGMVRFITEKNKIRFRINVDATKAANLSISSKLLQLAEIVTAEKRP